MLSTIFYIGRLCFGKDICNSKKNVYVKTEERRRTCKEYLRDGLHYPLEFINEISHIIGKIAQFRIKVTTCECEDEDVNISKYVCDKYLLPRCSSNLESTIKIKINIISCPVFLQLRICSNASPANFKTLFITILMGYII